MTSAGCSSPGKTATRRWRSSTFGMFGKTPVLTVNLWLALVYLFDEVTKVWRPLRRGLDVSVDDRLAPLGD